MNLAKFIPNPFLERELEHSEDVHEAMAERAEDAADEAKAIAPVETGAYRDSIDAVQTEEGGRVQATVPYAIYVEFGPPYPQAVLRRASSAAGLKLGTK